MLGCVELPEDTGELEGTMVLEIWEVGLGVGVTEKLCVGVGEGLGAQSQRMCFIS